MTDHCFSTIPSLPLDVIMRSFMTSEVSELHTHLYRLVQKDAYVHPLVGTHTCTPICTVTGMHTHCPTHMGTTTHMSLHAPKDQLTCVNTQTYAYMLQKESMCRHMHSQPSCQCVCTDVRTPILTHIYVHFCTQLMIHESTHPHNCAQILTYIQINVTHVHTHLYEGTYMC